MARVSLGLDTSGRPLVLDSTSVAKLRVAEQRLGFTFTVVQGSWRGSSGAAASAGTHDMGGVFDLRSWNIPANIGITKAVRVLRECGLIAWYRTQAQGFDPHIHCIDYGNASLSPSAARQVIAWEAGHNGLASNGPDDGPRVTIPKHAPTPPEEDMTPKEIQDAVRMTPVTKWAGKTQTQVPLHLAFRELEEEQDRMKATLAEILSTVKAIAEKG